MLLLLIIGLAFLAALLTTAYLTRPDAVLRLVGMPNERSLHDKPTPHTGGIGILIGTLVSGMLCSLIYVLPNGFHWLLLGAGLVALISLIDDIRPVPPLYRLILHILAAWLLLSPGGFLPVSLVLPGTEWLWPELLALLLCLGFVIWMLNLYNFMDGMDGFSGGMAVFGFAGYALLGWLADAPLFTALNLCIVLASLGFLAFNFPPARIFMGDAGASTLGFLAAAFALWAERDGIMPLWAAALIFSPFIADATFTLLRRLLKGEKVWQAHKTHCYQRLVELGWGHRKTVLWEYAVMLAAACSGVMTVFLPIWAQWFVLIGWLTVYISLIQLVKWLENSPISATD
ncbi:MAG: glycosyltransferase family 4 protein [Pseudomonadota bacterium]